MEREMNTNGDTTTNRREPLSGAAPWHYASYERFLHESLPRLLAERLPLTGYRVEEVDEFTCEVTLAVAGAEGEMEVSYPDLPRPNAEGLFRLEGKLRVVTPVAVGDHLATAEIRCAGELAYLAVAEVLQPAPPDQPWDEALLRAWAPLHRLVTDCLRRHAGGFLYQPEGPKRTNWLELRTNLRRVYVPEQRARLQDSMRGRVCPIEAPENQGGMKLRTVAAGAEIRGGRFVVLDERPEAALGLAASMIPLLEHGEPNRLLMGANLQRQWLVPPDPEPALVQTGREPDAPEFWCGRNLLTAIAFWGMGCFEDAIVVSESAARRMGYPQPLEVGDKLSCRFGLKGVIGRILPDSEMPHLADGTPVEAVYHPFGLPTRMNLGLPREAALGRVARAEGAPVVVPAFHAPNDAELHARLAAAGESEDGMEWLTLGKNGPALESRTTVGWVYWGKLVHLASEKIHVAVRGRRGQGVSMLDFAALREGGAWHNLSEQFNLCASGRYADPELAERVAAGEALQIAPPAPRFRELSNRLAALGIRAELQDNGLRFSLTPPEGEALELAVPVAHPWLPGRSLTALNLKALGKLPSARTVTLTNNRLRKMQENQYPMPLLESWVARLEAQVATLFREAITPEQVRFNSHVLFSARAIAIPAEDLEPDQVGVSDEIAWGLFGPLLTVEIGAEAVDARTPTAAQALDRLMARKWVIIHRAPSTSCASFLAFRAVRRPGRVIHLPPLADFPLNADYDGDQISLFLPLTEAAQREAGERLTLAAHLARNPASLQPVTHEPLWGLAWLSLTEAGREELAWLEKRIGATLIDSNIPEGLVTKQSLTRACARIAAEAGPEAAVAALDFLSKYGAEVAKRSGLTMSPFFGEGLERDPLPTTDDREAWERYEEAHSEMLLAYKDYTNPALGPILLAAKCGARGNVRQLRHLLGPAGLINDEPGGKEVVRHGIRDGLPANDLFAWAGGSQRLLAQWWPEWNQERRAMQQEALPTGTHVLARAMRSAHPGIVFARAAAAGEIDPLTAPESRAFVGLPPME